jgi:hypothetical protein
MQVETLLDLNSYLESQQRQQREQQQQHHHYHQEQEPNDEEIKPNKTNAPKRRN